MAAAEARAAWQRTANRCFVQEDAKRAPKLACCPSSSSTQQADSSNGNDVNGTDHTVPSFVPLNWNPMVSNLPPDTKWWLQLQPHFGYQKECTCEQLKALEDESEENEVETLVPMSKLDKETLLDRSTDVDCKKTDYSLDSPCMVSTAYMKCDSDRKIEEMKAFNSKLQQPLKRKADMDEYFLQDEELMEWKPDDHIISKPKNWSDMQTPWPVGKSEPWWRITDKDELASLVAMKSSQHIENCDLPRPTLTVPISTDPFVCLDSLEGQQIFSSSFGRKSHVGIYDPVELTQHQSASRRMNEKNWSSNDAGHLVYNTEKRYSSSHAYNTAKKDPPESSPTFDSDSSRAELLEALRRSQTRAREAEIAAKKAYEEKEHILKLLFRQASHLFAYKQWLHILQLESLCLQLKIKDHQISTILPVLPWMPLKGRPSSRDKNNKPAKANGKKPKKCGICRYAVAFAVGLGLAGAGLLLGWTLGCLLPKF
ncbi:hypothetical protein J5N97_019708 [Dioscorea zingiberensis]|uniref:Uncharacterized protein n=1 Tax=Dioscorea zingiberensis TaxID=325984 RepID=A0A9D5HCR4_9LILI|nr:hypothetical protein J5N97_019708 [Dioscorea zingiberensis]